MSVKLGATAIAYFDGLFMMSIFWTTSIGIFMSTKVLPVRLFVYLSKGSFKVLYLPFASTMQSPSLFAVGNISFPNVSTAAASDLI